MTIFANLHELPPNKHLYTLLIHNGEGMYDEVDVVAWDHDTPREIARAGKFFLQDYPGQRITEIADQSSGDAWNLGEGLLIGEDGDV